MSRQYKSSDEVPDEVLAARHISVTYSTEIPK